MEQKQFLIDFFNKLDIENGENLKFENFLNKCQIILEDPILSNPSRKDSISYMEYLNQEEDSIFLNHSYEVFKMIEKMNVGI